MRIIIRPLVLLLAVLLAAALASACASQPEDVDVGELDGADDDDSADVSGPIRLVANPWPGSYANANVASAIMADELGLDVEISEIDENAQWTGLDDGSLDAVLEVWPSGHAENYQTYITELGTVEDLGELGAVGQIGWFMPQYVLDEYPEMATWEGLEGNEEIFATAETGDSGQFLAADPSFVQFDETIIENLGLDFQVIQSGSEAAQLTAVESAIERGEPVLFYFYTPHWLHAKHDLVMVELPEFEENCEQPPDERVCGYPEDVLFKAVNENLDDKSPEAYEFLSNFTMSNEWQDQITFEIDEGGQSPADAAQAWVDDNEDVWRDWLP